MNTSRPGSPERGSFLARAQGVREVPRRGRTLLALRGAVAASALGVYTVAGAIGAFLALLPAALRPIPRGRAASAREPAPAAEASREPLAG